MRRLHTLVVVTIKGFPYRTISETNKQTNSDNTKPLTWQQQGMESFHHLFAAMKRKTIYFVQDLTSQVTFGALLQITRSSYVLISIFNMYVILCVSFRFLIRTFFGDCLYAQTKIFLLSGHESCSHQKQTFSLKCIKSETRQQGVYCLCLPFAVNVRLNLSIDGQCWNHLK